MKRFYAALLADEEFEDDGAWKEWQRVHPADLKSIARGAQPAGSATPSPRGGGGGGDVCFK